MKQKILNIAIYGITHRDAANNLAIELRKIEAKIIQVIPVLDGNNFIINAIVITG